MGKIFSVVAHRLVVFLSMSVLLLGCSGSDSNNERPERVLQPEQSELNILLLRGAQPSNALPGATVTLTVSGVATESESALTLEWAGSPVPAKATVSADTATLAFTVPDNARSGALQVRQGDAVSNALWFYVTDIGVVTPQAKDIVLDPAGQRVSIGSLMVLLNDNNSTRDVAQRLADSAGGTLVGRIPLLNGWQIALEVNSLIELQAIAERLKSNTAVVDTLMDIAVAEEAVDWSADPDRGQQRDLNRVEQGADLYQAHVHPTDADKLRPYFMSIGLSEWGIDFRLADFINYGRDGKDNVGSVALYAPQLDYARGGTHGSNVVGVLAAGLGNGANAGLLSALEASHGGANINVGASAKSDDDSNWSFSRLAQTNNQLEAGSGVINWSWGLYGENVRDCAGQILNTEFAAQDTYETYQSALEVFFANLRVAYPNAVIVASAGNGAADAGDVRNRLPTSIDSEQLIVVGAHISGGVVGTSYTELQEAQTISPTACYGGAMSTDIVRAPYSNYGERVDIAAAGSIMGIANSDSVVGNRGSSFAAPLVTATIALMQSINPGLTPQTLKNMLRVSALPVENQMRLASGSGVFTRPLSARESAEHVGMGARLNVEGAIQLALDSVTENTGRVDSEVVVDFAENVNTVTQTITVSIPRDESVFDKVDLIFAVDVSGSYGDDIASFRDRADQLIAAFAASGEDVQGGVVSFSDFNSVSGAQINDYAYRLDQSLTPQLEDMTAALNALTLQTGGDEPESQLEALFQMAQPQMGWREGALPLIFLATDASFHDSDLRPTYPGAGYRETLSALQERNIRVYGLQGGTQIPDVVNISAATGGSAYRLSEDSTEVVSAVSQAIADSEQNLEVSLQPFGDFAGIVESIRPQGGEVGAAINNVNPGDELNFEVVLRRAVDDVGGQRTLSFRLRVVADDVATLREIPVRVTLN